MCTYKMHKEASARDIMHLLRAIYTYVTAPDLLVFEMKYL